jgi:hypothetical protein
MAPDTPVVPYIPRVDEGSNTAFGRAFLGGLFYRRIGQWASN